jgi:hypothetical protein
MIFSKKGSDPVQPAVWLTLALSAPLAQASDCATDLLNAQRDQNWVYQVAYQGMGTEAARRLESPELGRWRLTQSMSLLIVSLNEQSLMTLSDGQLKTLSYLKEQKGLGARTTRIEVDVGASRVNTEYKGKSQSYALTTPLFDPLSHSLQIQIDRACHNAEGTLIYPIAGRSGISEYRYELVAQEPVQTPWGEAVAERWQREEGGTRDTLWLIPSQSYALARVEHQEDGELSSMQLHTVD